MFVDDVDVGIDISPLPSPPHSHTPPLLVTPRRAEKGSSKAQAKRTREGGTSHLSISIKLAALVGVWACAEAMEENAVEGRSVLVVVVVRLVGMTEAPLPPPPPP